MMTNVGVRPAARDHGHDNNKGGRNRLNRSLFSPRSIRATDCVSLRVDR
jgi:hypothetical protein